MATKVEKKNFDKKPKAIRTAYDLGFKKGWDDAHYVPNRFGCRTAAAIGYRKGIKSRYKSDKFQRQYQRWGNK